MDLIIQISIIAIFLVLGILGIILMASLIQKKTPFQKLNRFTLLAVAVTFFGLLSLNYSLLNSLLGSLLVLFLIRISYVIYVDSE